jgi:hypothetical protein
MVAILRTYSRPVLSHAGKRDLVQLKNRLTMYF